MSPITKLLNDTVKWKELPVVTVSVGEQGVPVATHEGVLEIFDTQLRVYRLSNGQSVIEESDMQQLLKHLAE